MIRMLLAVVLAAALAGCTSPAGSPDREPTGTPTDPVTVCKRAGDVCRMDASRLGVCNPAPAGTRPEGCADQAAAAGEPDPARPCFVCMSQH